MRREKRGFNRNDENMKRVLYIAGGILSLTVIAFIAIFILYGAGNQSETQLAKYNTSVIDNYSNTEETSTQMGKTVNEVEEESLNSVVNEVENTVAMKLIQ